MLLITWETSITFLVYFNVSHGIAPMYVFNMASLQHLSSIFSHLWGKMKNTLIINLFWCKRQVIWFLIFSDLKSWVKWNHLLCAGFGTKFLLKVKILSQLPLKKSFARSPLERQFKNWLTDYRFSVATAWFSSNF